MMFAVKFAVAIVIVLGAIAAWWMVGYEVLRHKAGLTREEFDAAIDGARDRMVPWLAIMAWPWTVRQH